MFEVQNRISVRVKVCAEVKARLLWVRAGGVGWLAKITGVKLPFLPSDKFSPSFAIICVVIKRSVMQVKASPLENVLLGSIKHADALSSLSFYCEFSTTRPPRPLPPPQPCQRLSLYTTSFCIFVFLYSLLFKTQNKVFRTRHGNVTKFTSIKDECVL